MSDSRKVEELMEFVVKGEDENAKAALRDVLKEKVRERLMSEVEN